MPEPLRFLILEDNLTDADLVQFELQEAGIIFTAKVAMTEEDYIRGLREFSPDLILSDYDLPKYSGALALAEANKRCPDTPFILVTGAVTEDRAIEILTQGAKDYVLKTRLQQRLVPAVRRALAEAEEHRARKQAEQELREAYGALEKQIQERTFDLQEAKERLSLALSSARMGTFEWDILNDKRYFDNNVCHLLGIKREEFTGKAEEFFKMIHPDDRRAVQDAINHAIEQDLPYETEYRVLWPDGSLHHIAARGKIQRDNSDRPFRLLGVCWEITEQKQTEKRLLETSQRLHTLMQAVPVGISFSDDITCKSITGNPAVLEQFEVRPEDNLSASAPNGSAPGRQVKFFRDGRRISDAELPLQRAVAEKKVIPPMELEVKLPSGRSWYADASGAPIYDAQGGVIGGIAVTVDITERKNAENELRKKESQERERVAELQAFMDAVPGIVFIAHDSECRKMTGSRSTNEFLRLSSGANMSMSAPDFERPVTFRAMKNGEVVPPEELPVQLAAKGRAVRDYELDIVFSDGAKRTIFGNASPVLDEHGNPRGAIGVFVDITQHKWMEEETTKLLSLVRQEKDKLQALINGIGDEVWFVNVAGEFTLANPSALREFQLDSPDGINVEGLAKSLEVFRPDGTARPAEEAPPLRALAGEVIRNQEETVRTPATGELRYRQVSSNPVRNTAGQIIGSVSVVRDITEHKQSEKALRDSERLYRAIGESIDYGIWVCDTGGRNIYASDSFRKLVGVTQEQCSNFGWGDVLHPDDAERTIAAWKECVRTGGIWDIEHRFRGVDGQWHPILARGVPVRNGEGEIICWAGINLDISSRKKTELFLKERTQQLEEANKELESFSYSVSHDLRAPLRAVEGYTRMFMRKYGNSLDEEGARLLNVVSSNTKMMSVLIDELLSFSRILTNSMTISPIDMGGLVSEVWDDIRLAHHEREIDIQTEKLLPCSGDRVLIRQVLFNLISNAVKFTKDRKPAIIKMSSHIGNNKVVYCIRDNGIGFDMAYYDKLFGVFQRLHSHGEYEGTGVGLAIVQRIVKRHGGDVWAEGIVGEGATFYFSLPQGTEQPAGS